MEALKSNSNKDTITATDHNEPKDAYKIAYIIHFILGAGNLLPWNALITAVDYFGYLYPNRHVERVFSVVYMASSLLVLVVLLSWKSVCNNSILNMSLRVRMNVGFSMFVVSLMATPIMYWGWHDKNGTKNALGSSKGYCLVVASVLVCGLADGLIGGSLIGTAGKLPKQYMQAVFAGTASSGVLISILRIITKASLPQTPQGLQTSTQFYFVVSSAVLVVCIVSSNLLHHLPAMHHHYAAMHHHLPTTTRPNPHFKQTLAKIKSPAFGIFLIYAVTLSIFPGFLAESIRSNLLSDWYPVVLIAVYNVSDFAGKSVTGVWVVRGIREAVWGCAARVLFYPLYAGVLRGPWWLRTEAPVVALTVMLGFSNGYLTSAIMMLAPKAVPTAEAEVAAVVLTVMLGMGLVAGSVVGWFWVI